MSIAAGRAVEWPSGHAGGGRAASARWRAHCDAVLQERGTQQQGVRAPLDFRAHRQHALNRRSPHVRRARVQHLLVGVDARGELSVEDELHALVLYLLHRCVERGGHPLEPNARERREELAERALPDRRIQWPDVRRQVYVELQVRQQLVESAQTLAVAARVEVVEHVAECGLELEELAEVRVREYHSLELGALVCGERTEGAVVRDVRCAHRVEERVRLLGEVALEEVARGRPVPPAEQLAQPLRRPHFRERMREHVLLPCCGGGRG